MFRQDQKVKWETDKVYKKDNWTVPRRINKELKCYGIKDNR